MISSIFSYCYSKLGDDISYLLLECCQLLPVVIIYYYDFYIWFPNYSCATVSIDLFCQDMSYCTVTGCKTIDNKDKPLVLKELKKVWNKDEPNLPWEQGEFSPSNTLLVDDSPYKALCNPVLSKLFS